LQQLKQTTQTDPGLRKITAITNVTELQAMENDLTGEYYLTGNIDASATLTWNGGEGFDPVGTFTGTFDGCGYTISDLYINRPTEDYVGLFGNNRGDIANVTLSNPTITGQDYVGPLAGFVGNATDTTTSIQNCHVTGGEVKVQGAGTAHFQGGLIGIINGRAKPDLIYVYDCTTSCTVDAENHHTIAGRTQVGDMGGFCGQITQAVVSNCRATGSVSVIESGGEGGSQVGGFCYEIAQESTVTDCTATGNVRGGYRTGGFTAYISCGENDTTIQRCSARGSVTSIANSAGNYVTVGGFAPQMDASVIYPNATILVQDCYSWSNITATVSGSATDIVAGIFCPETFRAGVTIDNCYATGTITSTGDTEPIEQAFRSRGFVPTVTNSFWDTESSSISESDYGTGHITTWMQTMTNYTEAGWDFETVWYMSPSIPLMKKTTRAESVCVIPSSSEDEIWLTCARLINGSEVRYIERMKPRYWGTDQEDAFFVDSGLTYDSTPTTTLSGLDHLEGETVAILGDGAVFPTQTVTNGVVTLAESVSVAQVGLPYTYKLKPMRMDQSMGEGTTKGSIKKIREVVVSFFKTLNARYGDGTTTRDFKWRTTEVYTSPPDLYTGDKKAPMVGGYSVEDPIEISGSDPLPCTVRAIILRDEVTGR
jgi:hypothetical protein